MMDSTIQVRRVLITGASGLVGRHIVKQLSESEKYCVLAVGSNKERLRAQFLEYKNVEVYSNDELLQGNIELSTVDTLVHSAFTRSNAPQLVAEALCYTENVFNMVKQYPNIGILHISTRSVYREPEAGTLNTEDSAIAPSGAIGIAKYASELMLDLMCSSTKQHYCNVRLASVNEIKTENVMVRPINVFVDCMLSGKAISVVGGMQVMSYIAPEDVASAIMALMELPHEEWHRVYNIGTGWMCTKTLLEIAQQVCTIGHEKYGLPCVDINVEDKDVNMHAGLNIERICGQTDWTPKKTLEDMISAVYALKMK